MNMHFRDLASNIFRQLLGTYTSAREPETCNWLMRVGSTLHNFFGVFYWMTTDSVAFRICTAVAWLSAQRFFGTIVLCITAWAFSIRILFVLSDMLFCWGVYGLVLSNINLCCRIKSSKVLEPQSPPLSKQRRLTLSLVCFSTYATKSRTRFYTLASCFRKWTNVIRE